MDAGQALSNLQNFQPGNSADTLQKAQTAVGLPQAQQQVTGLRQAINQTTNLLSQVAPSIMGRIGNSLVTAGQSGAQIQKEQAPIQQELTGDQAAYDSANSDVGQLQKFAQDQAAGVNDSQQNKLAALQNIYNDLYSNQQAAASLAEQRRQHDLDLAEKQRQFNLGAR